MTFVHSKDSRLVLGSSALAAYLTGITASTTVDTADSTALADTSRNYVPGVTEATITCSGLFEPLFDTPARAALGATTTEPITIAPAGLAVGARTLTLAGRATGYDITGAVGEVVAASIVLQGSGRHDAGVSLADLVEVTATGTGTTHADAGGTSNGAAAALHVTACSGSLVVKIQHSTNGSAWSDLVTFTTATGATSEQVVVAGAVNRYLRASWTLTGAGAAATFTTNLARR